jgi:vacuolar-type H+-ATPase subunit E/Vma4
VKELKMEVSDVKENYRGEIDRISNEKHVEIEKIKMEAERTTGGLRKLYQSLQVILTLVLR